MTEDIEDIILKFRSGINNHSQEDTPHGAPFDDGEIRDLILKAEKL